MKKKYCLILIFLFVSLLLACSSSGGGKNKDSQDGDTIVDAPETESEDTQIEEPEVIERAACGPDDSEGECSRGYDCLDSACVALGLLCSESQPEGECKFGQQCVGGLCWGEDRLCTPNNPLPGACPDGQLCQNGTCQTRSPCGPGEVHGACDSGFVCFEGDCLPLSDFCGPENPFEGSCPGNQICLEGACHVADNLCSPDARGGRCPAGETCAAGECISINEACSLANPEGTCAGIATCVDGICRNPDELCSSSNPYGFCPDGLSCVSGTCQVQTQICSYSVFDGVCPDNMVCSAGHCHGSVPCDENNFWGSCGDQGTCLCSVHLSSAGGACGSCGICSPDSYPINASVDQIRAIQRTNELRNSIGLWSINQDPEINVAATNHAEYLVNVGLDEAHDENQPDSEFFTGAKFWERMTDAGYTGQAFSEVIAFVPDPVDGVDGLIATVYHREPFFDPNALEMGYGGVTGPHGSANVINFGAAGASCKSPIVVVFPPHNAIDVPVSWDGREHPTPPAPPGGYPSGPILSVHGSGALNVMSAKILLGETELVHTTLSAANDPNGAVGSNHFFLYTHDTLRPNTVYDVEVTGTHAGQTMNLRWSFTTASH